MKSNLKEKDFSKREIGRGNEYEIYISKKIIDAE
jgi:hypothetical protein